MTSTVTVANNIPFAPDISQIGFSSWANDGGWLGETKPALLCFGKWATAITPGVSGSSDYGGVREAHLYKEILASTGVETWFLFYGAGDGTNTTAGEWRIQLRTSVDRGVTWTTHGPINIGLQNGSGTAVVSRDMLYMEKRGSTYLMHAMKGEATSAVTSRGRVPASPYEADVWTLADAGNGPIGTWVFDKNPYTVGSSGSFDDFTATTGCIVLGQSYKVFYSATHTSGPVLNVGLGASATPDGVFSKLGAVFSGSDTGPIVPENPKVFFNKKLGQWVMLLNEGTLSLGTTDSNAAVLSENLATWDFSNHHVLQKASPIDGLYALGLLSPIYKLEGIPIVTEDGYVPVTYDADPLGTSGTELHVGRSIFYSVLEPSLNRLLYTPGGGSSSALYTDAFTATDGTDIHVYNPTYVYNEGTSGFSIQGNQLSLGTGTGGTTSILRASDTAVNPTIEFDATFAASCGALVIFRALDGANHYGLDISLNNDNKFGVTSYKKVSNSYSEVTAQQLTGTLSSPVAGVQFHVKIEVIGEIATMTLSGPMATVIFQFVLDGTFTTAGKIGFRNGASGTGTRLIDNLSLTENVSLNYNFNGTDGTEITSYSASWVYGQNTSGITILGNQLNLNDASAATARMAYTTAAGSLQLNPKMTALMTVGADGGGICLCFRVQDGNNYYQIFVTIAGGSLEATLYSHTTASGFVQIGSSQALGAMTLNTQFPVMLLVNGNSFTLITNNLSCTFVDSGNTFGTAGYCGLANGGGGVGHRLVDNLGIAGATISGDTEKGCYISETNSDGIVEFALELLDSPVSGGFVTFEFRRQSDGNSYRLKCFANGKLQLFKCVGGTETSLGAQTGSQTIIKNLPARIRIKFSGNSFTAWLNGEQQISLTDSTYSSGTTLGFRAISNSFSIRNPIFYGNDTITVLGVPTGQKVVLRSPGGLPLESQTSTGNTLSFTRNHYPIAGIDVAGQYLDIPGNIYGGAALTVTPVSGGGNTYPGINGSAILGMI